MTRRLCKGHRNSIMRIVFDALAKAVGQLADPAVLHVLAKTIGVTLLVFAGLGFGLWWLIDSWGTALLQPLLPEGYAGPAIAFAAFVIGIIGFWLLFRIVALAVLQLFADEIVAAVEARHYPDMACRAKALPLHQDIGNSAKGAARAVFFNALALPVALILLITGIGTALVFLFVNAVLLGRELTDMSWFRHCEGDLKGNPVPKFERFVLGASVAGLMLVPVINLFAPVIGAAAGTHLAQANMQRCDKGHPRA